MNIRDLADLVPALMAEHPAHGWVIRSGQRDGDDLHLEIYPKRAPDRIARVKVMRSVEVYFTDFAGHSSVDFAYEDDDRPEVLQGRIDLAVRATLGPTRVTLHRTREAIVKSELVIDPDGDHREPDAIVLLPGYFTARLFRQQIIREVLDFPEVGSKPSRSRGPSPL